MGTLEPSSQPLPLSQVWFQNRRSKERRMKQLSALGARRHAFFRSPRRMRPLGGRLDESEMLGSTPYTYYGGKGHPRSRALHLGPRGAGASRDPLPPFYSCGTFGHEHTFIDNPQHSYTHPDISWTQNQTDGFTGHAAIHRNKPTWSRRILVHPRFRDLRETNLDT